MYIFRYKKPCYSKHVVKHFNLDFNQCTAIKWLRTCLVIHSCRIKLCTQSNWLVQPLPIHILHLKESFIWTNLSQLEIQHSSRHFLVSKSSDFSTLALVGYNVYMNVWVGLHYCKILFRHIRAVSKWLCVDFAWLEDLSFNQERTRVNHRGLESDIILNTKNNLMYHPKLTNKWWFREMMLFSEAVGDHYLFRSGEYKLTWHIESTCKNSSSCIKWKL